jgi:chromosome segregation ATPase
VTQQGKTQDPRTRGTRPSDIRTADPGRRLSSISVETNQSKKDDRATPTPVHSTGPSTPVFERMAPPRPVTNSDIPNEPRAHRQQSDNFLALFREASDSRWKLNYYQTTTLEPLHRRHQDYKKILENIAGNHEAAERAARDNVKKIEEEIKAKEPVFQTLTQQTEISEIKMARVMSSVQSDLETLQHFQSQLECHLNNQFSEVKGITKTYGRQINELSDKQKTHDDEIEKLFKRSRECREDIDQQADYGKSRNEKIEKLERREKLRDEQIEHLLLPGGQHNSVESSSRQAMDENIREFEQRHDTDMQHVENLCLGLSKKVQEHDSILAVSDYDDLLDVLQAQSVTLTRTVDRCVNLEKIVASATTGSNVRVAPVSIQPHTTLPESNKNRVESQATSEAIYQVQTELEPYAQQAVGAAMRSQVENGVPLQLLKEIKTEVQSFVKYVVKKQMQEIQLPDRLKKLVLDNSGKLLVDMIVQYCRTHVFPVVDIKFSEVEARVVKELKAFVDNQLDSFKIPMEIEQYPPSRRLPQSHIDEMTARIVELETLKSAPITAIGGNIEDLVARIKHLESLNLTPSISTGANMDDLVSQSDIEKYIEDLKMYIDNSHKVLICGITQHVENAMDRIDASLVDYSGAISNLNTAMERLRSTPETVARHVEDITEMKRSIENLQRNTSAQMIQTNDFCRNLASIQKVQQIYQNQHTAWQISSNQSEIRPGGYADTTIVHQDSQPTEAAVTIGKLSDKVEALRHAINDVQQRMNNITTGQVAEIITNNIRKLYPAVDVGVIQSHVLVLNNQFGEMRAGLKQHQGALSDLLQSQAHIIHRISDVEHVARLAPPNADKHGMMEHSLPTSNIHVTSEIEKRLTEIENKVKAAAITAVGISRDASPSINQINNIDTLVKKVEKHEADLKSIRDGNIPRRLSDLEEALDRFNKGLHGIEEQPHGQATSSFKANASTPDRASSSIVLGNQNPMADSSSRDTQSVQISSNTEPKSSKPQILQPEHMPLSMRVDTLRTLIASESKDRRELANKLEQEHDTMLIRLQKIEESFSQYSERLYAQAAFTTKLDKQVTGIANQTKVFKSQLDGVTSKTNEDLRKQDSAIFRLEGMLNEALLFKNTVDAMQKEFPEIKQKLHSREVQLDSMSRKLANIEQQISGHAEQFGTVRKYMARSRGELDNVSKRIDHLDNSNKAAMTKRQDEISALKKQKNTLDAELKRLESSISSLKETFTNEQSNFLRHLAPSALNGNVEQLNSIQKNIVVVAVNTSIDKFKPLLKTCNEQSELLMQGLDALKQQLNSHIGACMTIIQPEQGSKRDDLVAPNRVGDAAGADTPKSSHTPKHDQDQRRSSSKTPRGTPVSESGRTTPETAYPQNTSNWRVLTPSAGPQMQRNTGPNPGMHIFNTKNTASRDQTRQQKPALARPNNETRGVGEPRPNNKEQVRKVTATSAALSTDDMLDIKLEDGDKAPQKSKDKWKKLIAGGSGKEGDGFILE